MLGLFALLLLGYTLLAIWPVANFVDANSYKDEFRLVVDGNEDFCEGVKDSDGQNLYWKPKEYLSNNWVCTFRMRMYYMCLCACFCRADCRRGADVAQL